MKLGYSLLYAVDVVATVEFYEKVFGIERLFIHESNQYAEMNTGTTKLGFVSLNLAQSHGLQFQSVSTKNSPPGFELVLIADDVQAAFKKAVAGGAQSVVEPHKKPWGQVVSYVRDCNGFLIEICSSME